MFPQVRFIGNPQFGGTGRKQLADIGDVLQGKVERIMPFGAFVALDSGDRGMIHISQVDSQFVADINDFLREGDAVEVKVVGTKDDGKLDLSIKALQEPEVPEYRPRKTDGDFEKLLRNFMRKSNERQAEVKRRDRGREK